jgi:hypothetical protein
MSIHNPHDTLSRRVFSRKENAAGELRAVLPDALSGRIDWASLELVDGRFVDPELADRLSDLLFAADIDGHDALGRRARAPGAARRRCMMSSTWTRRC